MKKAAKKPFILALLILGSTLNTMGQVDFGSQRIISNVCGAAYAVYACDLDGDGDVDVLAAPSAEHKVVWYKNDGAGNFGLQQIITTAVSSPLDVFAIDMDGDNDMDVLSASGGDNKIAWYPNDGSGNFGEQQVISDTAMGARSVYACDIDDDLDIDVFSASNADNTIMLYKNDGAQSFFAQVIIDTAEDARSVYVSDMDNDADLDILSASFGDDKLTLFKNDGTGYFGAGESIRVNGIQSVYAADIDDDGDNDLLAAGFGWDEITWYENYDGEHFSPAKIITDLVSGVTDVYATDLDDDGDIDVISASMFDRKIAWYENDGTGTFGPQQVVTTSAVSARSVFSADLDGDGDMDLLSASSGDHKVAWYENTPPPEIIQQPADKSGCETESVTIPISANFAETYVWQINTGEGYSNVEEGTVYSGVNTSALSITNASADMTGDLFRCIVKNQEGELTSEPAALTIFGIAEITSQPESNTSICQGEDDITLHVVASGAIAYQWYLDESEVAGANSSSLTLPAEPASSGTYSCEIQCGSIFSDDAVVEIQPPTTLISQPTSDTTVCENGEEILLEAAASGAGTISFQWYFNDTKLTEATNTTLSIPATLERSGNYYCAVTAACGTKNTTGTEVDILPTYTTSESSLICSGSSYTFPDGTIQNQITEQVVYTSILESLAGCDSIVETTVNVHQVDTSVSVSGFTLNANSNVAITYQWIDCNNDNAPVTDAISQQFTPTTDGSYAVIIDDGTCTDTSNCYSIVVTGIMSTHRDGIAFYPNPAHEFITIEGTLIKAIELKNIKGQSLLRFEVNKDKSVVNLSSIKSGIYFLEVTTVHGKSVEKIQVL